MRTKRSIFVFMPCSGRRIFVVILFLIPPNHFTNKPDKWHGQCRAIASKTLAYDLNNEWAAVLSHSLSLVDSFAKIRIQRTCSECLYFVLFHLNMLLLLLLSLPLFLTLSEMSVLFFSVLLLVFGIVFTFNAHRSGIRDHFSCYWIFFVYIICSSLSYSFTLALSLCFNAPAIQPLFICFTLFVYLYLCT